MGSVRGVDESSHLQIVIREVKSSRLLDVRQFGVENIVGGKPTR